MNKSTFRRVRRAGYYYHLTHEYLGDKVRLVPTDNHHNRGLEEIRGARVCVCPTPLQCFVAVPHASRSDLFVYRTCRPIKPFISKGEIFDRCVTREKWLLAPIQFRFFRYVNRTKYTDWPSTCAAHTGLSEISRRTLQHFKQWNKNHDYILTTFDKTFDPTTLTT